MRNEKNFEQREKLAIQGCRGEMFSVLRLRIRCMEIRRFGRDGVVDCEEVQLALSCRMSVTGDSTTRIRLCRGDWPCVTSGGLAKVGRQNWLPSCDVSQTIILLPETRL